jgi:hypothetical protein
VLLESGPETGPWLCIAFVLHCVLGVLVPSRNFTHGSVGGQKGGYVTRFESIADHEQERSDEAVAVRRMSLDETLFRVVQPKAGCTTLIV